MVKEKSSIARSPTDENLQPLFIGSNIKYNIKCNSQLLVALDHNQLRTMASETLD